MSSIQSKPSSKIAEVINLSVVRDPDCLVFVRHRLAARCGEVDDTQTLMSETTRSAPLNPGGVRPTMAQSRTHCPKNSVIALAISTPIEYSGEAAHERDLLAPARASIGRLCGHPGLGPRNEARRTRAPSLLGHLAGDSIGHHTDQQDLDAGPNDNQG